MDFKGTLVCDGWRSYPNFTSRIQRYWANLLIESKYIEERIDEAKPLSETLQETYFRLKRSDEDRPPSEEMMKVAEDAKRTMECWARRPYKT